MDQDAPWRAIEGGAVPEEAPRATGQHVLLLAAAGIVAASLGVALAVAAQQGGAVEVTAPGVAGASAAAASPQNLIVEVAGAVARPGVYELPGGSRVADAIDAAGGYAPDVDPRAAESQLNLAARIQDGQVIRVPRRGEAASAGASGAGGVPGTGLVDLNTATAAELDTLPGVGPVTAQKIITAREEKPFSSVQELLTRKVVTASTFDKLQTLVTVE
jgi:competence protein ComEA